MFDTQRILFSPANDSAEFANAQWADTIPRLLQARLIQSFENYDIAHAPLRNGEGAEVDYQLLIDIREFQVAAATTPTAKIAFSARLLNKQGKVVAARLFSAGQTVDRSIRSGGRRLRCGLHAVAQELIAWTVQAL